jgi:adenosylcobyric acid synthase
MRTQVILHGRTWKSVGPGEWDECRPRLWQAVTESLDRLRAVSDLVIIEGAGSPVKINLKKNGIVNMRVARSCGAPVLLAASIELGGMFAALVGTLALLDPEEKTLVKGFIVNRFHGDPALRAAGLAMLEELTEGRPTLGIIPFIENLRLPQEDAASLPARITIGRSPDRSDRAAVGLDIAVVRLPHLSNADDCDALAGEEGVSVRFVSSVADLGTPDAVRALAEAGAAVVGICGGYQMLGLSVRDPRGSEGAPGAQRGLGLLPVETELETEKATRRVCATVSGDGGGFLLQCAGARVEGYEIHRGRTLPAGEPAPVFMREDGTPDGAAAHGGRVWGTYLHGVFDTPGFRRAWLRSLGWEPASDAQPAGAALEREIDRVAGIVAARLDMARVRSIAAL